MTILSKESEVTLTIPDGVQLNGLEPGTKVKISFKEPYGYPPVSTGDEQNRVSFKVSCNSEEKK